MGYKSEKILIKRDSSIIFRYADVIVLSRDIRV